MGFGLRRLALACLLVVSAAVIVAGGSAANRDAEVSFEVLPGPARVSYGENVAYRATFTNTGGSMFTHVVFRMRIPYAQFGSAPYPQATFVASTCPTTPVVLQTLNGPEWNCDFGKLKPGTPGTPQLILTVVWKAPDLGSASDCVDCLKANGRWTIKEGVNDIADPNDSFPPGGIDQVATLFGTGTSKATAAGYETNLEPCTDPLGAGSLGTAPQLAAGSNPFSTTVCLPSPIPSSPTDLGLVTAIDEVVLGGGIHDHGPTGQSTVCIASLGQDCGAAGSYTPYNFAPAVATFVFRILSSSLDGGVLGQISHNGSPVGPCPSADPNGCIVSQTLDTGTGVWTVVATAPTNGPWTW